MKTLLRTNRKQQLLSISINPCLTEKLLQFLYFVRISIACRAYVIQNVNPERDVNPPNRFPQIVFVIVPAGSFAIVAFSSRVSQLSNGSVHKCQ